MTVRLARGTSVVMLVEYVNAAAATDTPWSEVLRELTERYALSFEDARLAIGRVQGGITRARSNNPANEPDQVKDPIAWTSYQLDLGIPVVRDEVGPTPEEKAEAIALVDRARRLEPTRGTPDVGIALEVARQAIRSTEGGAVKLHVVLEAATCVSVAGEACIDQLGGQPCALEGSQTWVDGIQLANAAREIAAEFARGGHPELEERSYALAGRIVTQLVGQSYAHVGRAMLESARCMQRNGNPQGAADRVEPVIADFQVLLDRFAHEAPLDEYRIGMEYLLAAIELIIAARGPSPDLDDLRARTLRTLNAPSGA